MTEPRTVEVEVEDPPQKVRVVAETRRTLIKLKRRIRPVWAYELQALPTTFVDAGVVPQPVEAVGVLAAALDHAAAQPDDVVVVVGHGEKAEARARALAALVSGDGASFAEAASGASVKEWQTLLTWVAKTTGVACDPLGADGKVGKNTRTALSNFRQSAGVAGGNPDAPEAADWQAFLGVYQQAVAGLVKVTAADIASRGQALEFLEARVVACGGSWPASAVQIQDHTTMADERVDILFFRPKDAPKLGCHAGGGCDAGACDIYAKGKYRCVVCGPDPRPGWTCVELESIHFDFDRSFVRPDGFDTLGQVKALLDEQADREAMLYGHTDIVGDETYNKALSERRARSALAVLTHDVAAWDSLWNEEGWGDAITKQMVAKVGEKGTRKALIQAYMQAAVAEPTPAARFRDFGGKRFMGCSELNPIGDGKDERSRRVVAMVYDPARAPRGLPCKVGDLAPCKASVRPAPANQTTTETATFTCAVYRQLAAQCVCRQEPKALKIESFLGRPAAGGELAKEVRVAAVGEKVVLAWKASGATDVTLARRGADGKRVVVQTGIGLEGELEVTAEEAALTFVLEASAGETNIEFDEVKVHAGAGLRVESFLVRPAKGGNLVKELLVGRSDKVVLVWKAVGASDVTISRRGPDGARTVVKAGAKLEGELETVADAQDITFVLEASASATELELDEVHVTTDGPPPPPPPPPGGLRIESFLGTSSHTTTPSNRVLSGVNAKVKLSWVVVGAKELALFKTERGKARVLVAKGLKASGELETTVDVENLTFTLEAAAGDQVEFADVVIDFPLSSQLVGRLHGTFDEGSEEEVTIPQGAKLELAYRVKGEPERVKITLGKTEVLVDGPKAEDILVRDCPNVGSFDVFLEATKGPQSATNLLVVKVVAAAPLPKIISFVGAPRLDEDKVAFAWTIEGPFDKVTLQPYGVDVTKHTSGGKGTGKLPWPVDGQSEFTLVVQKGSFFVTAKTTVKRPEDPPEPVVTGELHVRLLGSEEKFVSELKDPVPEKGKVELFFKVSGPFKTVTIGPGVGPVPASPGTPFGTVTVDPFGEKTQPDAKGHYTLFADGKPLAHCTVHAFAKALVVPFEVGGEWEQAKAKTVFKYFKVKLKGGVGLKGKAVLHGHPDGPQNKEQVKLKFNNKGPEISLELKKKLGLEADVAKAVTPQFVVDRVKKVERKDTPIKWNPKKGEVSIGSIKYEVTFKPYEFEIGGKKATIGLKLELEGIGLKFGKDKETGEPKRVAGSFTGKLTGESNVIDKVLQNQLRGLPYPIIDVTVFVSGGLGVEPAWEAIGRDIMERIGFEAAMTFGLVLVAVGTVVGTVRGGMQWADIVSAPKQRGFARKYYEDVLAGLPAGLDDPKAEDEADTVGPEPPTLGFDKEPKDRGAALGRWYRARNFAEYRKDAQAGAEGLRAAAEDVADADQAAREEIKKHFREQWVEKRRLIEFKLKKTLWDDIRRAAYFRFREESHGTPDAMDTCFRSLYMEPPRTGFDYDFPEVDDKMFELAMADQLHGPGRELAKAAWKEAGYWLTPPNAEDRRRKRELRKQPSNAPRTAIDISSGKLMRVDQSSIRDETLALLKDRGLTFTGKSDANLQNLVVKLGWLDTFVPGHVIISKGAKHPKVTVKCIMRMLDPTHPKLVGFYSVSEAIVGIFSSDHGAEFIEVSVAGSGPSYVRAEEDESP